MVVVKLDAEATGSYGVATVPEARGLGLARILTLQALHPARDAGSTLGVLHSAPMAISSHQKLGFRAVAPFAQRLPGCRPRRRTTAGCCRVGPSLRSSRVATRLGMTVFR